MRETLDTTPKYGSKDLPDGERIFKVIEVRRKELTSGVGYIWLLGWPDGTGEQMLFPGQMGDLLRVLGCKEIEKNKFDWDTDDVITAKFMATVSHEPDKKDASKIRQQMKDFKPVETKKHKKEEKDEIPF